MKPWKILVPYDGSKQSDKALKKAVELAELIKKGGDDNPLCRSPT